MTRRSHFRPTEVMRLTREPPFTDDSVAELIASILRNRYAAMDTAEIAKLQRSWNSRHSLLFGEQEARDRNPSPETKEIELLTRQAAAVRRTLHKIREHRQRELEAARSKADPTDIFYARLRMQEIDAVLNAANHVYVAQTYVTPDWLHGLLDEIEAAIRVTADAGQSHRRDARQVDRIAQARRHLPII
jgi:hypothetical protein